MENPTFKLEKVVKAKSDDLEDFNGPMDLILNLLSRNKIEIQDIQITAILEQYLEYIDQMKKMDLEIASDFVNMASYLIYLKTKMLLSSNDEETLSEMEQFKRILEERRRNDILNNLRTITDEFRARNEKGLNIFVKRPEYIAPDVEYKFTHPIEDLTDAISAIKLRYGKKLPPPISAFDGIIGTEPYSITQKITELMQKLVETGVTRFRILFSGNRSRSEIVATFISILELCFNKRVRLAGTDEDCTVTYVGEDPIDNEGGSKLWR